MYYTGAGDEITFCTLTHDREPEYKYVNIKQNTCASIYVKMEKNE